MVITLYLILILFAKRRGTEEWCCDSVHLGTCVSGQAALYKTKVRSSVIRE